MSLARSGCTAAALAAASLLALAASPAAAQTSATLDGGTLTLTSGPEANAISFGGNSLLQEYVEDTAGIVAGTGCTQMEPTKVDCPGFSRVVVRLGDGADTLAAGIVSVPMDIAAEGGDDTVYAGGARDTVDGGPGNDDMTGNSGNDVVDGGPGDDTLRGGGGDDRVTGGSGRDSVNGDGPEVLDDGNDVIEIADGETDQAQCGFGADVVHADARDVVETASCETIDRAAAPTPTPTPTPQPTPAGPVAVLAGASSRAAIGSVLARGYRFRLSATQAGAYHAVLYVTRAEARRVHLGRSGVDVAVASGRVGSAPRTITLRVKRRYRTALRRARRVRATLIAAVASADGTDSATRTVTLVR